MSASWSPASVCWVTPCSSPTGYIRRCAQRSTAVRARVTLGFAAACLVPAVAVVAWVFGVTWSGAKGKLTAYPLPRFLVGIAVLLLGIGIWFAVRSVQVSVAPFAGDRALLVTSAYGFVLVGTVVADTSPRRGCGPRWRHRGRGPAGRHGVRNGCDGGGHRGRRRGRRRGRAHPASTRRPPPLCRRPPPPETRPGSGWWWWSERTSIREVVAAGAGVVVATHEGIVALDGRTGQERWHYRRTDTSPGSDSYGGFLVAVDGGLGRDRVARRQAARLRRVHRRAALARRGSDRAGAPPPPQPGHPTATTTTVVRHRYSPVPEFVGTHVLTAHAAFKPDGAGMADMKLNELTLDRLDDRRSLLAAFDSFRRDADQRA